MLSRRLAIHRERNRLMKRLCEPIHRRRKGVIRNRKVRAAIGGGDGTDHARRHAVALQDVVALAQAAGDVALGVEDALALHLGRVGRQHRRDVAVGQRLGQGLAPTPARFMRDQVWARLPSCTLPARSCTARRRMWWRSSARLARWLK